MMPRRVAQVVAAAALAGLLAGCAGAHRVARVTPAAGGSWEAVLPGPAVGELLAERGDPKWITTRNDRHLNLRPVEPILATTTWPQPARPSLSRPRYIRIQRSPEGFIYYRTEERYEYRRGR